MVQIDATAATVGTILSMIIGAFFCLVVLKQRKDSIEDGLNWPWVWWGSLSYNFYTTFLLLLWTLLLLLFLEWAVLGLLLGIPVGYLAIRFLKIDVHPVVGPRERPEQSYHNPEGYEGD